MLENVLKPDWLEKKPRWAFAIGFIYALIGIMAAWFVFPSSHGIASLAFLSVLLVPVLNKIFDIEERQDSKEKKFSIQRIFKDHADVLEIYFMLFLGIFFAYALLSLQYPNLLVKGTLFDSQLRRLGYFGNAVAGDFNFYSIFLNNFKVILIFFVLSLLFGAGSILFLSWNASVWGIAFASISSWQQNAFNAFSWTFIKAMPHMFAEAGGYFFAIVAGGIMSQGVLREKLESSKFSYIMKDGFAFLTFGVLMIVIGAALEVYLYPVFG